MNNIADIAVKALETADNLTKSETIRLAAWVLDHEEHVQSHQRLTSPGSRAWQSGSASLTDRLAAQRAITAPAVETVTDLGDVEHAEAVADADVA